MKTINLEVSEKEHFTNTAKLTIKRLEEEDKLNADRSEGNKEHNLAAELPFLTIYEYVFNRYNHKNGRRYGKFEEFFNCFTEEQISKYNLRKVQNVTKDYFLGQHWPNSEYNKHADC